MTHASVPAAGAIARADKLRTPMVGVSSAVLPVDSFIRFFTINHGSTTILPGKSCQDR